jgi:acetyl/propionyl-CoA carboxylase alpha subunit
LLVANRGEIAVRVIRAARAMGIRTVAVASDADLNAMHARLADVVAPLGGSEPAASYLDIGKVIDAARAHGADAIHPGYGFLSERSEFARACEEAGIVFVGPPARAMDALGAKISAKALAVDNGVPVTPGLFEPGASPAALREAAGRIGYPVMLKASAGGGGRGMRVVRRPEDFDQELGIASDEALKAFGDGAMMVEKLIERPRHIEVQILADAHGEVVALFERECSIQRRHQKLIEEAPSPALAERLGSWEAMREASVRLARAAGYVGAGTVEFMLDEASGEFYFLEVNARLQVEHPVTELVTGLDLVRWQLRIARGERIDLPAGLMEGRRDALVGHAIEARIVAEDPAAGFMPSVGRLQAWREPKGPGVRVDTGYEAGAEVSRYYDSLIAKVIAHGAVRGEALARLDLALREFHVIGVKTNIAYLLDVIRHPEFVAGRFDTGFLGREFAEWREDETIPAALGPLYAAGLRSAEALGISATEGRAGVWDLDDGWRIA